MCVHIVIASSLTAELGLPRWRRAYRPLRHATKSSDSTTDLSLTRQKRIVLTPRPAFPRLQPCFFASERCYMYIHVYTCHVVYGTTCAICDMQNAACHMYYCILTTHYNTHMYMYIHIYIHTIHTHRQTSERECSIRLLVIHFETQSTVGCGPSIAEYVCLCLLRRDRRERQVRGGGGGGKGREGDGEV